MRRSFSRSRSRSASPVRRRPRSRSRSPQRAHTHAGAGPQGPQPYRRPGGNGGPARYDQRANDQRGYRDNRNREHDRRPQYSQHGSNGKDTSRASDSHSDSRSRMRAALLHIGDSSDNLDSQIERLVVSMERDLLSHAEFMVDIILQGVMYLPGHSAIFASLTAQFTAAEPSFITMMLSKLHQFRVDAFRAADWRKIRTILRFTGYLALVRLVPVSDWSEFAVALLQWARSHLPKQHSRRVDSDDEGDDAMPVVESNSIRPVDADAAIAAVCTCVPALAEFLIEHHSTEWLELLEQLRLCDTVRVVPTNKPIRSSDQSDFVGDWLRAVLSCSVSNEWHQLSVQLQPWRHLSAATVWNKLPQPPNHLHVPTEEEFNSLTQSISDHRRQFMQAARMNTALHSCSQCVPMPVLQLFPTQHHQQPDSDANQQMNKRFPYFAPLDRLTLIDIATDIINVFVDDHELCAKQLMQICLPIQKDIRPLLIETIFSEMLRLPASTHSTLFYANLLFDFIKTAPKELPPLMGQAVHALFSSLENMHLASRSLLANWFALHLSNFSFTWPWQHWLDLLLSLPLDDPRCSFVHSTLQQCIELSYFDRIVKTLPERLVASPLMPAKPVPAFRYASSAECSAQSCQYASQLLRLLCQKAPWESVWLNVQSDHGLTLHERVDILVQCLLQNGSDSYSHTLTVLDRYKELFKQLVQRHGDARSTILQACQSYWLHSSSHFLFAADKLLSMHVLDSVSAVNWCFQQLTQMNESEAVGVDTSNPIWSLICTSLHKAQRRVLKLQQSLHAQTDKASTEETIQLAEREQNDAFNTTKQQGVALLQSLQGKHERRAEVVQGQLYALAVQFADLQSLLSECE